MRKPEDQINVVNSGAETIAEALGITPERRVKIQKRTNEILEEEFEKEGSTHADAIVRVYNEFENGAECAFCLYILNHEEARAAIHSLFNLPEAVAKED